MRTPLYTKYRPQNFEDVTEQKEVVDILQNQIATGTVRNAYLFTGSSGVGKTTLSRVLAKEINKGNVGIIEMDAASNNGVDDVRNILDQSNYISFDAEYKIYIIDECFIKGTQITTQQGYKNIEDVVVGDCVLGINGWSTVRQTHKKCVQTERLLRIVFSNGNSVVVTKDHLFMTTSGWVSASALQKGDELIYDKTLRDMREGVCTENIRCENLPLSLRFDKIDDRGGWENIQYEKEFITRYKETRLFEEVRVDSVEIYKPADNGECGDGSERYTEVYDLTTDGSYCVNGVLVHNCHQFSAGAWAAWLKTLEEPPAKTIFMFCTTDYQKIPDTIINRVQRFDLAKISYEGIVSRLKYIVEAEHKEDSEVNVSSEVISYIAKLARGGMRDAVTMLDKCICYKKDVVIEDAVKVLGSVNYDTLFDLFFAMYNFDSKSVIEIVESVYNSGRDLKLFITQFTNFIADICKYKLFENTEYVSIPDYYKEKLDRAKNSEEDVLKNMLDSVNSLKREIKYESNVLPVVETELLLLSKE